LIFGQELELDLELLDEGFLSVHKQANASFLLPLSSTLSFPV
jgi:hypothetical protein